MICGQNLQEKLFENVPANQRRRPVIEGDAPPIALTVNCVLGVGWTEIRVVFILVPTGVKLDVRIAEIYLKPVSWPATIPDYLENRDLRTCLWLETDRIERRSQ